MVPIFPTPRSVHSSILTEERQNMEFSLTISVSFPLLSVKPSKEPPCLFRQLVQESNAKKCCFMGIYGESDQDGHGTNLGYNSATREYIAVNRNETFTTKWHDTHDNNSLEPDSKERKSR